MNLKSTTFKNRLLSILYALSFLVATSPIALAAEEKEDATPEPVWVMSWAGFIFFGGATVIICVLFSRRRDTILTAEEQKQVSQLRADRMSKRRKEERLAKMRGPKK